MRIINKIQKEWILKQVVYGVKPVVYGVMSVPYFVLHMKTICKRNGNKLYLRSSTPSQPFLWSPYPTYLHLSQQKTKAAIQLIHSCGDYTPSTFVYGTLFPKILYKDENNASVNHIVISKNFQIAHPQKLRHIPRRKHTLKSGATKLTLHVNKNCWKQVPHHHFVNITFIKHKTQWPMPLLILQKYQIRTNLKAMRGKTDFQVFNCLSDKQTERTPTQYELSNPFEIIDHIIWNWGYSL